MSGQKINQFGRSEHSTWSTLPPSGEGPFAQDSGFLKSHQRRVRALGSYSIATSDSLAVHDWVLRKILNDSDRHGLSTRVNTSLEFFDQTCDPFRDIGHPANGSDDRQREELHPAIDATLLIGAKTLDVPIGVLSPNNRHRYGRRQCESPTKKLLDKQSTHPPVAVHEWMDDLKTGMSNCRVSHRSEIGAIAEGD